MTGIAGRRRIGYEVNELITYIKDYLGWSGRITATLLGVGAWSAILLDEFQSMRADRFVFDSDPEKICKVIRGHEVYDTPRLGNV